MSDLEKPTANELLGRAASDAMKRVRDADSEAIQAQYAFAAGKFEDYFNAKYGAAAQRVIDEYHRSAGQAGAG